MREGRLTQAQLRRSFDDELASALAHGTLGSDSGLDVQTQEALRAVAAAHPQASADLIARARRAFVGQLDGSNAAARDAAIAEAIAEHRRRRR